jgi:branched-subunit amino acid transport protein
MSTLSLILGMALVAYTLRLTGLLLAARGLPPTWERVLGCVPVATLTALIVASLSSRSAKRRCGWWQWRVPGSSPGVRVGPGCVSWSGWRCTGFYASPGRA